MAGSSWATGAGAGGGGGLAGRGVATTGSRDTGSLAADAAGGVGATTGFSVFASGFSVTGAGGAVSAGDAGGSRLGVAGGGAFLLSATVVSAGTGLEASGVEVAFFADLAEPNSIFAPGTCACSSGGAVRVSHKIAPETAASKTTRSMAGSRAERRDEPRGLSFVTPSIVLPPQGAAGRPPDRQLLTRTL